MQMDRRIWMPLVVAALTCLLSLSAAFADTIKVGDKIRLVDREGTTGGGEFGVRKVPDSNPTGNPAFDLFRTFCVQRTEFIDFNSAGFNVVGITDKTVAGDDPLDTRTAFLYTRFREGTLSGYDFAIGSAGRVASADALQRAIWYIENEPGITSVSGLALTFYNHAVDATTAGGLTDEWVGMGIGNVRIMNLTWATSRSGFTAGAHAQDQLVLVPQPQAFCAGAGLLGSLMLMGMARGRSVPRFLRGV